MSAAIHQVPHFEKGGRMGGLKDGGLGGIKLLTDHIAIWTDADTEKKTGRGRSSGNAASVYGIRKLRELILELAVRGKLVSQDANDEPASALLKRIQAEKAKLITVGKIKQDKPLPAVTEEEKLFALPQGWAWVRLGEIQSFTNGYAFKSPDFQNSGVGVIRIGDVGNNGEILTNSMLYYPLEREAEIPKKFKVNPGDLIISMTGNVKLAFNNTESVYFLNQRVGKIELYFVSKFYVYRFLTTVAQEKIENASGGVIPNVSTEEINESAIPLPPLAEQHRIVAKVDELMALCDQLETRHNNAAAAHEKLVSHLLATLTQSKSPPFAKGGLGGIQTGNASPRISTRCSPPKPASTHSNKPCCNWR
ncbi:MAG: Restriction modification system DNA specificity domain-containing protein [Candidatus Gallionella acididurans]|uniref:Restriction modification system DNA specificity domain-containing protein n=1 Tax=Candidatus Gallionella acididurans TaxID=1796491 RepID=A0A139BQV3_9PROT|nr:MAG: Restriction modification system DNA specificity domain-containing protein [Candidatus Gallionella acididurans]